MLRFSKLELVNLGPFDFASLRFLEGGDDTRTVALLTGENGTGKTIVLDAIRALAGPPLLSRLERDPTRPGGSGIAMDVWLGPSHAQRRMCRVDVEPHDAWRWTGPPKGAPDLLWEHLRGHKNWVVDYWRSEIARDPGTLKALKSPDHHAVYQDALSGTYRNVDVTEQLCFFDYLRDSRRPDEQRAGEVLWAEARRIVEASLLRGGRLVEVERSTFTPMVEQAGQVVPLHNLSSGNAYLIGRMLTLLGRMYSVSVLHGTDPAECRKTPGVLLIDEAENHLHPEWQKRFLPTLREVFPGLQIIATTHSPFVLASVPEARVFVCRLDSAAGRCTVSEEEGSYGSMPVDEILASDAFDGTRPFRQEISDLIARREQALASGDEAARRTIEAELRRLNPTYFGYLDLEARVRGLGRSRG